MLLALLAFFFLFRVDKVYVVGNTRYTDEEVKEYVMTTPLTSNTVLAMLFERHKNAENIPFVDSFDLERVNAHTIRIHVNEKKLSVISLREQRGCILTRTDLWWK